MVTFKELMNSQLIFKRTQKSLKRDIKLWLSEHDYTNFRVRVDTDKISLIGDYRFNDTDMQEFMEDFEVDLILTSVKEINNISLENYLYPVGEYVLYEYLFE